ncbi:Myosin-9 [Dirofilaria immitis]|nr:Myosin-9 [Dirofilaria immitis]
MAGTANQKLTTEMRSVRDESEELLRKLNELSAELQRKEEELVTTLTRYDEERSQKQVLVKQIKELGLELQETKDDLESEKTLRTKLEMRKRDFMEELEALKQELMESQDKTQANVELRAEREKQYLSIKKEFEETATQYEQNVSELKAKHSQQLDAIRVENELLKKQMQQIVETRSRMENELQEKVIVIQQNQSAYLENERRRKNVENLLSEWQMKAQEAEKNATYLKFALTKEQSEVERLTQELESSENVVSITDLRDAIDLEKSQNEVLKAKLRSQDDELEILQENKERDELIVQKYEKNEDMLSELNKLRFSMREMGKKQRKFDQVLEEEKSKLAKVSIERDRLAQELRENESNTLVISKEVDVLRNRIAELENIRNTLQMDLDNAVTTKDDTGRSVLELDRMKRQLETELANAKETIIELEDNLQITEDAKLRLDVTLQATNAKLEKILNDKERDDDERRKIMFRKLGDLESELESERRTKLTLMQQKRKLEFASKRFATGIGRIEELKRCRIDASTGYGKRSKSLEEELAKVVETNVQLATDKRRVERERDEAVEELNVKSSLKSTEDKKRLEAKIYELEGLLEEEQNNTELDNDKLKKLKFKYFMKLLETLTTELAAERSLCEKLEMDKQNFEKQCKDLKVNLEEMENNMRTRSRGQIAALEAKLQAANEQCAQMEQERNTANRHVRRMEKKLNDTLMISEEEKRNIEQLKEVADHAIARHRQMRRQIEDLEEEASRERLKRRQLQRSIDDLNEANETLTRENSQLKSLAALARRSGLNRISTSRFGSETDSVGRGARSFGGDSSDFLQPNSGSTIGSYAGDDPDLAAG